MRCLILVALVCVATPVQAQSVGGAPYLTLTIGSAIDLTTTLHALHTVPGAVEANPFLSHGGTTGLVIGKVVSTAALALLMQQIGLRGHPRVARSIGYVAGVALGGLGARNARVGR